MKIQNYIIILGGLSIIIIVFKQIIENIYLMRQNNLSLGNILGIKAIKLESSKKYQDKIEPPKLHIPISQLLQLEHLKNFSLEMHQFPNWWWRLRLLTKLHSYFVKEKRFDYYESLFDTHISHYQLSLKKALTELLIFDPLEVKENFFEIKEDIIIKKAYIDKFSNWERKQTESQKDQINWLIKQYLNEVAKSLFSISTENQAGYIIYDPDLKRTEQRLELQEMNFRIARNTQRFELNNIISRQEITQLEKDMKLVIYGFPRVGKSAMLSYILRNESKLMLAKDIYALQLNQEVHFKGRQSHRRRKAILKALRIQNQKKRK